MTGQHEHQFEVTFPNHRQVQRICYCDYGEWWTRTEDGRHLVAMVQDTSAPPEGIYWRDMNEEERETYQELMDA